jgi:hypothetical protein
MFKLFIPKYHETAINLFLLSTVITNAQTHTATIDFEYPTSQTQRDIERFNNLVKAKVSFEGSDLLEGSHYKLMIQEYKYGNWCKICL